MKFVNVGFVFFVGMEVVETPLVQEEHVDHGRVQKPEENVLPPLHSNPCSSVQTAHPVVQVSVEHQVVGIESDQG